MGYTLSDGSESKTNSVTLDVATSEKAGLMSAEDKQKLEDVYDAVMSADTLENSSWIAIATAASNGTAKSKWKIGDTKTITLTTGEEITVRIIGFDHDAANSITFEMADCLNTRYSMNSSNTDTGGWDASALRSTLNGAIFDTLPDDLKNVVRTVQKTATNGQSTTSFNTSSDKLFLLALNEIISETGIDDDDFGWQNGIFTNDVVGAYAKEGTQYEWYKKNIGDAIPFSGIHNNDLSPLQKKRSGSNADWWYRSVVLGYSGYFWYFYSDGVICNASYANGSCAVSFAFCV